MPLVLNGTTGVQDNSGAFVAGTAVASTSGTSIDFTSIPSWVKRVTIALNNVSTNGSSDLLVQVGSGSVTTSGYGSNCHTANNANGSSTAGYRISAVNASNTNHYGLITIALIGSNTYIESHSTGGLLDYSSFGGGGVALGGVLDRVRITTINGTDTFDAGSINILYE